MQLEPYADRWGRRLAYEPENECQPGIEQSASDESSLGADLTQIYNDAYQALLGDRHPNGLGQPYQDHCLTTWESINPLLKGVLQTGQAVQLPDQVLSPAKTDIGKSVTVSLPIPLFKMRLVESRAF